MIEWLCWFVLLTVALRLVFPAPRRVEVQLPTTVDEALASPIPLWWEVEQCTVDKASGPGTILNHAAACARMAEAPLHPAVLALHATG